MEVNLMQELTRGLEAANQLCLLLADQSHGKNQLSNTEELMVYMNHQSSIILSSFDNAISMLGNCKLKYGDNGTQQHRKRSCYNKRTIQLESVKTVNTNVIEYDGYSWRKYGQKSIANAKHPREYYRCGYRNRGCQAIKHVQLISENPNKYNITYYGQHSRHNFLKNGSHFEYSPNILSFENNQVKHHMIVKNEKPSTPHDHGFNKPSSSPLTDESPSIFCDGQYDPTALECRLSNIIADFASELDGGFQDLQLGNVD